jgi:hypothetical protein
MRKAILSGLCFFSLVGTANAGTITAVGAVKALTNVSQMFLVVGNGNFDEGPTSGGVPANVYSAQGLTWQSGPMSSILPGVTNTGTATFPQYGTWTNFPAPIGGGGTHVGQSNNFAGVATFSVTITQVGLTASSNGTQYLTAWNKAGAVIGQVTWTPASDSAFVGIDTMGVPIGMIAYGNHDIWAGQPYAVAGSTIISDSWMWATGPCTANAQCDDANGCTDDICQVGGVCVHVNNAAPCNDGNACTKTDTCSAGACVGAAPVTCAAADQCHAAGTCNPASGVCSNPAKPDGAACNDGNGCTQTDACQAGVCTGANPVVCPAPDGCHVAGTCNAMTGVCTNPAKPDGSACSDSNPCTQTDTCIAGACTGTNPVVCAAVDACHVAGTCNVMTGMCSSPAKPDGSTCNDGNACTQTDTCVMGACTGSNPVTCAAKDACHGAGACDAMTGKCSEPVKADGTACDDGNACTQTDTCVMGACTGASPVTCAAKDACHTAGTCDSTTGKCSDPAKADGTACDDGDTCTQSDSCQAGTCTGKTIHCVATDSCHEPGMCDGTTGKCTNPAKVDGASCFGGGRCTAGVCSAADAGVDAGGDAGDDVGVDAGANDASGAGDALADTGSTTPADAPAASGGCGCEVRSSREGGLAAIGLGLLAMLVRRRRSRG